MDILWMKIGLAWLIIVKVLTAIQDAIDSEPIGLKPPLGRILYYIKAIGGYLGLGNRVQSIGGKTNATFTVSSGNDSVAVK